MGMKPFTIRGLLMVVVSSLGASPVLAGGFLDAHRSVSTALSPFNAPDPLLVEHEGYGLFDESLLQSYFDKDFGGYASAEMSQLSTITSQRIDAAGSTYAYGSTDEVGTARTTLSAVFEVEGTGMSRGAFLLRDFEFGEPGGFNLRVALHGSSAGTIFDVDYFDLISMGEGMGFEWDLDLAEDTYVFEFSIFNSSFKGTYNEAGYALQTIIPSPGSLAMLGLGTGLLCRRQRATR